LVQSELHAEDEGREGDGNPGEPYPDAATPRVPEALTSAIDADHSRHAAPSGSPEGAHADADANRTTSFNHASDVGRVLPDPASGNADAIQGTLDLGIAAAGSSGFASPEAGEAAYLYHGEVPDPRLVGPSPWLQRVQEEIVAWVKTLVSAAVYAILIVTFGFQVARVEGQSMAPTLEDQDRLIVNKLVYRIGEPRRGDIVMLYYPLDPNKSFVKRVIAEEGDTVRIVEGRVYVNDVPLQDDYVPMEYRSHDDLAAKVIEPGYYFVLGDHRNNSSDSRHWGLVPKKYIIGKVQLRWWPVPEARVF
jgi:signal peptidase I